MMRARSRRAWLALHRWMGLSLACLLLLSALTGILLVLAKPLDKLLNARLFRAETTVLSPLQPMVASLRTEFGPTAAFTLRLPAQAGDSLQASVSGQWNGTVYIDPETGRELGRRAAAEGFFNTLFELHSTLYAADTGRAALALAACGYTAMLLSGLVLWWPVRWRHAFSMRTRSGLTASLFDLHRVAGTALGLLVLVSVATGAYMAWRPLAAWVTHLSGQSPVPVPQFAARSVGTAAAPVDASVERVRALWPEARVSSVHVPARGALRVRVRLPDDPHPIGMSTVWLDPQSGAMLVARRWSDRDAGTRAYSFVYPLHTGDLAAPATLIATFLAGLALAGYAASGLWLWWRRRSITRA